MGFINLEKNLSSWIDDDHHDDDDDHDKKQLPRWVVHATEKTLKKGGYKSYETTVLAQLFLKNLYGMVDMDPLDSSRAMDIIYTVLRHMYLQVYKYHQHPQEEEQWSIYELMTTVLPLLLHEDDEDDDDEDDDEDEEEDDDDELIRSTQNVRHHRR